MKRIRKMRVPTDSALERARRTTMFQPNRVWARSLWRRGSARVGLLASLAALGTAAGVAVFHAGAPSTVPVAAPPAPPPVEWTPEEIATMGPVLLLQAGKSLEMDVAPDNAAQVQAGGTWEAEYGQFNGNGVYTAPSFTPPTGSDEIRYIYSDNSGMTTLQVRVLPNPDIPGSENTPYVELAEPSGAGDSSDTTSAPPQTQTTMMANRRGGGRTKRGSKIVPKPKGKAARGITLNGTASVMPQDEPLPPLHPVPSQPERAIEQPAHFVVVTNEGAAHGVVADPGQTPPGPSPYVGMMNLPLETAGTDRFYRLPVSNMPLKSSPLGARYVEGQEPLKFAREAPVVSTDIAENRAATDEQVAAYGGCPAGAEKVIRDKVKTNSREGAREDKGEITVSGALSTDLKAIGIKVAAGAVVKVSAIPTHWYREQTAHTYVCRNSRWVHIYSTVCRSRGLSYWYNPYWAYLYYGYPAKNAPIWEGWNCNRKVE